MAEMMPRQRLLAALRRETPDRVPCCPLMTRWTRYHHGCVCPRHRVTVAEAFGLDLYIRKLTY